MTDSTPSAAAPIPPDDPARTLVTARADDAAAPHVAVVGDTYTILLTGRDTAGRFTLIDMHVPPGGGPPPHRHDFEESFTVLEGEIQVTFRGATSVLRAGETANVPANAPHAFRNAGDKPARLHCICSPAGQEDFFMAVGAPVAGRTTPAPELDDAARAEFVATAVRLAPQYRSELLGP
jgi:quercetin dioxygenase-like cupin family protein